MTSSKIEMPGEVKADPAALMASLHLLPSPTPNLEIKYTKRGGRRLLLRVSGPRYGPGRRRRRFTPRTEEDDFPACSATQPRRLFWALRLRGCSADRPARVGGSPDGAERLSGRPCRDTQRSGRPYRFHGKLAAKYSGSTISFSIEFGRQWQFSWKI
ncbi:Retinal dehydrogenase 2 [Galemys pyrenaicus]|uniref:Retinal dehydrogenase 2 n=1 Tax=Galemys pyrenaicus TaxID=202257 RepID=A0A8J5ZFE3_GALPY|nr:Retinal dehydrogenase 2 [Galemys pyrenaicus]